MKKKLIGMILAAGAMLGAWAANVRVYVNISPDAGWGSQRYFFSWSNVDMHLSGSDPYAWPGVEATNTVTVAGATWHYIDLDVLDLSSGFPLVINDNAGRQTVIMDLDPSGLGEREAFFVENGSVSGMNEFSGNTTYEANVRIGDKVHDKVQLWEGGPYWATMNIGADEPWDSGYYFWWGDTIGYKRENGQWVASDDSMSNFEFYNNPISMTTCQKVSILRNSGWIITKDGENYLVPEHDAAHVQWGGDWRMPTGQEIDELREKCEWTWTTTNGVIGYIVRGRGDYASSSVFIPAAGCGDEAELTDVGMDGFWSSNTYWHDSTSDSDSFYSKYLSFDSTYQSTASFYRYYGRPIRPVCSVTAHGDGEKPDVTINAGEYFKATLAELGYDVPTDGQTAYSVKAYGLPAGLKLVSNKAVKDKKGKVITKANVEWWIEGVPTAALDYATNPAYLVITVDGKTETLPLSLGVRAQDVTELDDLSLGDPLNEQFYLPGVTNGWTVTGLPTGLKYTAKLVTTTKKKGKKIVSVTTNALPFSVYGKTTKAGLFTITAKKKVGAYYETLKFRVLVNPAPVDTAIFGDELTNIVTMAYVPVAWDLTGGSRSVATDINGHAGRVTLPVIENVVKVAGLPAGVTFAAKDTYKDKNKKQVKQYGQTIVGKPTKPGTYVVTFTKNVTTGTGKKKKTVAKTAQILWTVEPNDAELEVDFNTAGGVVESGVVGLKYDGLMAFTATSNATVTASGLPAGIKLVRLEGGRAGRATLPDTDGRAVSPLAAAWGFEGFTAKAGTYLVTVKATLNGKSVTQRVALVVEALPAWAKDTFNGVVSGEGGLATITVSAAGKISGKFYEGGTNWTVSAASYTAAEAGTRDACPYQAFVCSNVVAKYSYKVKEKGKNGNLKTVTKTITREFALTVSPEVVGGLEGLENLEDLEHLDVSGGTIRGVVSMVECGGRAGRATLPGVGGGGLVETALPGTVVTAWQNLWSGAYKAVGKKLFTSKSGNKTLAYRMFTIKATSEDGAGTGGEDSGDGHAERATLPEGTTLTLKVTTAGTVTATLIYDTGKKKNKKPVYYKSTCSTVVIPVTAPDAEEFAGEVPLYFAPSPANNFPGCADLVTVQP